MRISMPGHSTSGADGVGECGCAVPGFAPEKKLATFAVQVGQTVYIDVAIALCLMGYVATISFAKYLISGGE